MNTKWLQCNTHHETTTSNIDICPKRCFFIIIIKLSHQEISGYCLLGTAMQLNAV